MTETSNTNPLTTFKDIREALDRFLSQYPDVREYKQFCKMCPELAEVVSRKYYKDRRSDLRLRGLLPQAAEPTQMVDFAQVAAAQQGHIPGEELVGKASVQPPPTYEDYEKVFRLVEDMDEAKGNLIPQQAQTTFRPEDNDMPIGIAFTGDWHLGAAGVLYGQLRRDMEIIKDTPGLYAIGMGDYKENVKPQMKPGNAMYANIMNEPGLQSRMAIHRAEIARNKWLVIADGNHDAWDYSVAGISSTPQLATHLGVPFFGEGGGTVFVEMAGVRYAIGVKHNNTGNSRLNTTNAQRRAFDEWPNWENMDVICLAHFHFNDLQKVPRKGGSCVYLRSGTYKAALSPGGITRDGYAAKFGYTPEYGVPIVILLPKERRVIAFRGDDFKEGVALLSLLREKAQERG